MLSAFGRRNGTRFYLEDEVKIVWWHKGLVVVSLALLWLGLFLTSGCVSTARYKRDVDAARAAGRAEHCGLIEDALKSTSEENEALRERLRKFNQLDDAGRLRKKKGCPDDGRHKLVNGVCVDVDAK
jgi:hypothetical protein